jgi:hypothetical protein
MEYRVGMEVHHLIVVTRLARITPLAYLRRSQFTWVHKRKCVVSRVVISNSVRTSDYCLCETWDVYDVNDTGFMCMTQFDRATVKRYKLFETGKSTMVDQPARKVIRLYIECRCVFSPVQTKVIHSAHPFWR